MLDSYSPIQKGNELVTGLKQYHNLHHHVFGKIKSFLSFFLFNLNAGNAIDDDFKSTSPKVQISGSDTFGAQDVGKVTSDSLEHGTVDTAGFMTVSDLMKIWLTMALRSLR